MHLDILVGVGFNKARFRVFVTLCLRESGSDYDFRLGFRATLSANHASVSEDKQHLGNAALQNRSPKDDGDFFSWDSPAKLAAKLAI